MAGTVKRVIAMLWFATTVYYNLSDLLSALLCDFLIVFAGFLWFPVLVHRMFLGNYMFDAMALLLNCLNLNQATFPNPDLNLINVLSPKQKHSEGYH